MTWICLLELRAKKQSRLHCRRRLTKKAVRNENGKARLLDFGSHVVVLFCFFSWGGFDLDTWLCWRWAQYKHYFNIIYLFIGDPFRKTVVVVLSNGFERCCLSQMGNMVGLGQVGTSAHSMKMGPCDRDDVNVMVGPSWSKSKWDPLSKRWHVIPWPKKTQISPYHIRGFYSQPRFFF